MIRFNYYILCGIIVSSDDLSYSVYDSACKNVETKGVISIPTEKFMEKSKSLRFLRHSIIDIINNTKLNNKSIEIVGLRIAEKGSLNINRDRIEMEGVIKEAFASSIAKDYFLINKKIISDKTGIKWTEIPSLYTKNISNENINILNKLIDNWLELSNRREK